MPDAAEIAVGELHAAAEDEALGRTFAVSMTWTEIRNAEYEIVQRIVAAAGNIGAHVHVVDDKGRITWSSHPDYLGRAKVLGPGDCLFTISIHFESPRIADVFSYAALWNPPEFYEGFGYERTAERLASHNDVLSCRADFADAHAENVFAGFGRRLSPPLPVLFHTVTAPEMEPNVTADSRLFYVGINWERVNGKPGRHQDLLARLDKEGLIDIYGPEEFLGVKPWEGFQSYRGSVPFDGRSILSRINDAGVCLAFSSDAHQRSGIMSNRLFEGLAAGAAIIANKHPFIDKFFADCVYVVDDQASGPELADRIREILLEIRRDPAAARERARIGQARFREHFTLETCLRGIFREHPRREREFRGARAAWQPPEIAVVLNHPGQSVAAAEEMLENARRQADVRLRLVLVCDDRVARALEARGALAPGGNVLSVAVKAAEFWEVGTSFGGQAYRKLRSGPLVAEALASVGGEFFCLMEADDHWFRDHLACLADALRRDPGAAFACSGKVAERLDGNGTPVRVFEELVFKDEAGLLRASRGRDAGRFLYRRGLLDTLKTGALHLLDGFEHRYLGFHAALSGPLVQSSYATYVHREQMLGALPAPIVHEQLQPRFIHDTARADPVWRRRMAELAAAAAPTPTAAAPGQSPPALIERSRSYKTCQGGAGLAFLGQGFSTPETEWVWIDGLSGSLHFALERGSGEAALALSVAGRAAPDGAEQACTVFVDGEAALRAPVGEGGTELHVPLPRPKRGEAGVTVDLELRHAHPVTDAQGGLLDARRLGLRLAEFKVVDARAEGAGTVLRRDHHYGMGLGGEGLAFARSGFSGPEGEFTWIEGLSGLIEFKLEPAPGDWDFVLTTGGRGAADGAEQVCTVLVNGGVLARERVGQEDQELRVRLPALRDPVAQTLRVELQLRHAEPVRDADGRVADERRLGLRVVAFGVYEAAQSPAPGRGPQEGESAGQGAASGVALLRRKLSPLVPARVKRLAAAALRRA